MVTSSTLILGIICFIISCLIWLACILFKDYMSKHDTDLSKFNNDEIKKEFLERYKEGKIK